LGTGLAFGISSGALGDETKGPQSALKCPDGQNIVVHLKRHIDDG
jgi:hypothetical protein